MPLTNLQKLIATSELPELGPGPRSGVLLLEALDQALDKCLSRSALPSTTQELIRATVLLWHDHLDAAHRIAQDIHGPDGSLLHAIMHRREPDYGNAKYWFHKIGQHGSFPELAQKAEAILQAKNDEELRAELLPGGVWDPFAFVDACEGAASRPISDPRTQLLRAIQRIELQLLLERFAQTEFQ